MNLFEHARQRDADLLEAVSLLHVNDAMHRLELVKGDISTSLRASMTLVRLVCDFHAGLGVSATGVRA